ncbi:hypothetical protein QVL95_27225 [Pseudomonas aeruginosa]|uniref:DUF6911 family protein n=1 Tax=Pseudomonas aeruginosa TaxID=287 RepID=UPI0035239823|nr:hypothetical protein [Pseudomonas aeruginosa]
MMAAFSLSWVFGVGAQAKGGRNRFPSWDDVLSYLELIREGKGSVTLELISKTAVGPQSLQVQSEGGKYVVSLGEDDGVDYIVRSYRNLKLQGIPFEVLGDVWDGVLICDEFSILKNIFEEFFLTGDVNKELLN